MLDLPKGTNLAFHALVVLAKRPEETVAIAGAADSLGASPTYMAHLFQKLARAGLVVSRRGSGGGYSLARCADEITLWDVILALGEKDPGQTSPLHDCPTCSLSSACPIENGLKSAAERAAQVFQQISVAGLAALHEGGRAGQGPEGPANCPAAMGQRVPQGRRARPGARRLGTALLQEPMKLWGEVDHGSLA